MISGLLPRKGTARIQAALSGFNLLKAELEAGAEQAKEEAQLKLEEMNALRVEVANLDLAREQALKAVAGIEKLLAGG